MRTVSAAGERAWGGVQREPGASFRESAPSELVQDILSSRCDGTRQVLPAREVCSSLEPRGLEGHSTGLSPDAPAAQRKSRR